MKKILGYNETSHDAAMALIDGDNILFAAHAERYSKVKNDWYNNDALYLDLLSYGIPDKAAYYEKSRLKKLRILLRGGSADWKPKYNFDAFEFKHHYSHAAAGYYTSTFDDAVIVVLDAIGEFNTSTIWSGNKENISLKYKQNYPFSFGLFYSAFTQLIGLMPNQEEYIMMGMAAYGNPDRYFDIINNYFPAYNKQSYNFHKGIKDWPYEILNDFDKFDIAAAVQKVYELRLLEFMRYAKIITNKKNLVFMGGCALNSSANTLLWKIFDDIWIMPNPGDAGSSLGAALALRGNHIRWDGPYLGYDLGNEYPVDKIINRLLTDKIAPVAAGRAEFGPRALGNRSILADPRDPNIKDEVNKIKQRELFRPFAPVVMEEYAHEWFDMPINATSPYMQYTFKCLKPDLIPAVVHENGTSRVQTVNKDQHPGLYEVLKQWYEITGIPVLLNTSLNIKGQPLLNDWDDIEAWNKEYGQEIIT